MGEGRGWTDGALIVWCDKVRLSGLSIGRISGRVDTRLSHAARRAGKQSPSCIRTIAQACKDMLIIHMNNKQTRHRFTISAEDDEEKRLVCVEDVQRLRLLYEPSIRNSVGRVMRCGALPLSTPR